jgi:glyoxalase-like protein
MSLVDQMMLTRTVRHAAILVVWAVTACSPGPRVQTAAVGSPAIASASAANLGVEVDHVMVAIDSLERGIALLRAATGLAPSYGGAHPGRGTQNALLSLGAGRYLELIAPNPEDAAGAAQAADFATFRVLTPIGWAVRTHDVNSLRAALVGRGLAGGQVVPGARLRPDGRTLRWRTLTPWGVPAGLLPFFIEWDPAGPHPSSDSPIGCTLAGLSLASPSPDSLRAMLIRAGARISVTAAPREAMSLTLDCPAGRVTLGGQ